MDLLTVPSIPLRPLAAPARRYIGEHGPAGYRVWAVGQDGPEPLRARHSAGLWSFTWGRFGASARELAWALIHDVSGDASLADDWCGDLCADVVSRLPRDAFTLSEPDLLLWLDATVPVAAAVPRP